jgi:hypothetical protein
MKFLKFFNMRAARAVHFLRRSPACDCRLRGGSEFRNDVVINAMPPRDRFKRLLDPLLQVGDDYRFAFKVR